MPAPEPDLAAEFAAATLFAELRAASPAGFDCEGRDCGKKNYYRSEERPRVFECAACGKQRSVTAGTILHGSHVSLVEWMIAAKHVEEGCSATGLAEVLNRRYETAWRMMHRLRLAFTIPERPAEQPADTARARWPEDPVLRKERDVPRAYFHVVPADGRHLCVRTDLVGWRAANGPNGSEVVWAVRRRIEQVHGHASPRWYPSYFQQVEAARHGRSVLADALAAPRRIWRELADR
jgi:transposase-like protein